MQTYASSDSAPRYLRKPLDALGQTIEILERERDQLIPLVVEGPPHLRSLRSRQLKSIERQLVAALDRKGRLSGFSPAH